MHAVRAPRAHLLAAHVLVLASCGDCAEEVGGRSAPPAPERGDANVSTGADRGFGGRDGGEGPSGEILDGAESDAAFGDLDADIVDDRGSLGDPGGRGDGGGLADGGRLGDGGGLADGGGLGEDAALIGDAATAFDGAVSADGGGTIDAGPGASDVGTSDSGPQPGSGDIWVEINYSSAFSPGSPAWSFSATPEWGPADWAMAGDTWPEAWDRFNNMAIVSDPIGTVLEVGSGSELQLMLGLEELLGYDFATVRIEGRSRATSSHVYFDVLNPLNGCGSSSSMAQDWTLHVEDIDLGSCMVIGAGVQAVRVDPTSGTIALVRMRLTLHGARW